jgi:pyruvate,water dikinase
MIVNSATSDPRPSQKPSFEELGLSPAFRLMFGPLYRRARKFRFYREAISSLYTFGYGLFRPYFLALGDRLVRRGVIPFRDDVFYLYFDEVRAVVENGSAGSDYADKVATRKSEMEQVRNALVPETIFGEQAPPLDDRPCNRLTGIPTSRGYYTGPVKVVQGIRDFDKLQVGDVLAIPFSDVGWTPLFTKAGAVISEAGGILSHSSIVAREYNIPAVVSVSGACSLEDNTVVMVDGFKGEISIHQSSQP